MSNDNQYPNDVTLLVTSAGVAMEVRVNDVPLSRSSGHRTDDAAILNPWLLNGANALVVRIDRPGKLPITAGKLQVTIQSGPPDKPRQLLQYIWPNEQQAMDELPASNPQDKSVFTVALSQLGPWVWHDSPPAPLTPGLEQDLTLAFKPIYEAFAAADANALARLSATRDRELARAWGVDAAQYAGQTRADWEATFGGDFRPRPIEPMDSGSLLFEPCWSEKVYRIATLKGDAPLATLPDKDGLVVAYDVFLGRANGRWLWVR